MSIPVFVKMFVHLISTKTNYAILHQSKIFDGTYYSRYRFTRKSQKPLVYSIIEVEHMIINTKNLVPLSEANRNFSKVARLVAETGAAIVMKNK